MDTNRTRRCSLRHRPQAEFGSSYFRPSAFQLPGPISLERRLVYLRRIADSAMVATLDQRVHKLLAMAKAKCDALGLDLDQILATPETQLATDDEKLIRELVRLLSYIDSLR